MGMEWAWLIPVMSFAVVPLVILFGKHLPGKGSPLSILAIAAGFILFWFVFADYLGATSGTPECAGSDHTGSLTCNYTVNWFEAGLPGHGAEEVLRKSQSGPTEEVLRGLRDELGLLGSQDGRVDVDRGISLNWGVLIDPLTIVMLGLITFVALMVQVYSLGYMHGDPRIDWYYAFHALFIASMLTLAVADNFLLLYVAWELVGVCSYLLIGFWFERPAAREAAKKAFIVTRIGDVGLLIGILLLWREVGSFSMTAAFDAVQSGAISQGTATIAALLLFAGAAGKSAQFPLHVWLPDAMEGPTPVSALIHAATMVVAGVYLVARTFPIFEASGYALQVVSVVGLVTALGASTIALTATDLKRILAYSTISHLGLMMLSLGAFGYTAAVFHLLTHGFAKALLFLGAGSVMHSTDELDIRKMGGLRKVMPLTALLFSIGALSLGGIPVLAGFWSKDEILLAVSDHLHPGFLALALLTAFLSALYMGRAMFAVFFGALRPEHEHVHDAPPAMAFTMGLLGVLALGFGVVSFNWPGPFDGIGAFVFLGHAESFHFSLWLGGLSIILAAGAFVLAYLVYARKSLSIAGLSRRFAPALRVAENKYYVDELYQWVINRVVLNVARAVGFTDRALVNDVAVNGPANSVRRLGVALRVHVTGHVYSYALGMTLGAIALAVVLWLQVA